MSFNGNGVFNRIYSWVTDAANGVLVSSSRMDTDTNDIANGLSNCITKDGQQVLTANIPFAGYKITGLGTGSAPTDSVNYAQVFTAPTFAGLTATGVVSFAGATSVSVPTVVNTDNSTNAASTAYVTTKAFTTALPLQTGNSGKVVTTNGTTASWSLIGTSNQMIRVNSAGTALEGTLIGTASQTIRVNAGGTALEGYTPPVAIGSTLYLAFNCGGF